MGNFQTTNRTSLSDSFQRVGIATSSDSIAETKKRSIWCKVNGPSRIVHQEVVDACGCRFHVAHQIFRNREAIASDLDSRHD